MAKQRSGLGRGLNSLLGGPFEETTNTPERCAEPQRERYTVSADDDSRPQNHMHENRPAEKVPAPKATPVEEVVEGDLYTDKAENTTIKRVTERAARPEPPKPAKVEVEVPKEVDEISIDLIFANPDQPRTNFKKDELEELAQSIQHDGLLQPILVRAMGDGTYQIIAGERRWQACQSLGLKKVPVRVKQADDNRAIELALVENIQRSNLNPIEEAYGYRRMMERSNLTQSEVAQAVSKGRSTIANALRLLELPEDAQQLLFEEKITAGHARAILSIPTEEGRKKLTEKLVKEKLSVREAENIARLLSGKKSENATPRVPTPRSYKKVAKALRKSLNTSVRVKTVKGKNKIEIEFTDEEDLQRLFDSIVSSNQ